MFLKKRKFFQNLIKYESCKLYEENKVRTVENNFKSVELTHLHLN